MTEIAYVNANGDPININDLKGKHAPVKLFKESLKRVDDRASAKVSQGYVVLGYSPDVWAQKDRQYAEAIKANEREPNEAKHPGTPDEFERRWMSKNRPGRARSRPYEIASAADQCAELMRKAGWLQVRVEEILKG